MVVSLITFWAGEETDNEKQFHQVVVLNQNVVVSLSNFRTGEETDNEMQFHLFVALN